MKSGRFHNPPLAKGIKKEIDGMFKVCVVVNKIR